MKRVTRARASGKSMQGLMKKVALLVLICFAIRFLSSLGAGDAFDGLLRGMGENSGLVRTVMSFELGELPERSEASEPTNDGYPAESLSSPPPGDYAAAPASTPAYPTVTAMIAENVPLPSPNISSPGVAGADMRIINNTSYEIDVAAMLGQVSAISLAADKPQILIVHTHSSEAYSGTEGSRTLDKNMSVIKVGDVLTEEFEAMGFNVLHDREIYDYPSYSGSYSRSLEAVESYLKQYPEIQIVIDLHRDSLTNADGSKSRTEFEADGLVTSQVMLLVATGEAGLSHPNWQENLKFGLHLQASMDECYPGLSRPLLISTERYNQQAAPGSILMEVGTDGNSIEEAVGAVRLFAVAAEPVIKELIK